MFQFLLFYHLNSNNLSKRSNAIKQLGNYSSDKVYNRIMSFLNDESDIVRNTAIQAISQILIQIKPLSKRLKYYEDLEKIPSLKLNESTVNKLIEDIVVELRHLYSRSFHYEQESYVVEEDHVVTAYHGKIESTYFRETKVAGPDEEAIRKLISQIPLSLLDQVKKLSGEVRDFFND